MKIAILGAGITGCLLSELLKSTACDVSVFEKSRGCGGRASTKQLDWGQCDLGATIVPAKGGAFIQFMHELSEQNLASQWPKKIYAFEQKSGALEPTQAFSSERKSFVFNHKMNAACKQWIRDAKLYTNSLVTEIRQLNGQGWQLKVNDLWLAEVFDKIILTAPWPQNQQIINDSVLPFSLANQNQDWTSCWSVAIKVEQKIATDIDLLYLKGMPIQTLVRDSAKPERPMTISQKVGNQSEIWVAQLANELSDSLAKIGKEQAIELANNTFIDFFNTPKKNISHNMAHYWRFARPLTGQPPLGLISQPSIGFYAAGDWSFGASIEAAFEAAKSLHKAILTD